MAPMAANASGGDNINKRSRAFVQQMNACAYSAGLAIQIVQKAPNDLLGASRAVNTAKSTCQAIRDRMAGMDTRHFDDQALDGEVAVDYYTRGLGRFSNYIDEAKPSDLNMAVEYFTDAKNSKQRCLHGINARRAVYGFGAIS
jgi:ribulose kinase